MCPTDRPPRVPTPQAPPAPTKPFDLEHSEEAATFACKKKDFRGPLGHQHATDCEALRFFIAANISSTASSPANPELIHITYAHNINSFVITMPIDYMPGIIFGATAYFETDAGTSRIYYTLTYDTHVLTEKFVRTDRNGKARMSGVTPNLDTFRASISAALSKGSYELERVWNYPSPSGLFSMDFGFTSVNMVRTALRE